jgi:hypothetical protein
VQRAKQVTYLQPVYLQRDRAAILGSDYVANHEQNAVTRQRVEGSIGSATKKQDYVIAWKQQGINVKFEERATGVLRDRAAELPHLESRRDITLNYLEGCNRSSRQRYPARGIYCETGVHYFTSDDHLRLGDSLAQCGRRYSFALHLNLRQRPGISVPPDKIPQECIITLMRRINNFLLLRIRKPSPGIDSDSLSDERERRIAGLRNHGACHNNCDKGNPCGREQPTRRQSRWTGDRAE